jgi:hypothetical protein
LTFDAPALDGNRTVEIAKPRVADAGIPQCDGVHHVRRQIGHGHHGFEERQRRVITFAEEVPVATVLQRGRLPKSIAPTLCGRDRGGQCGISLCRAAEAQQDYSFENLCVDQDVIRGRVLCQTRSLFECQVRLRKLASNVMLLTF